MLSRLPLAVCAEREQSVTSPHYSHTQVTQAFVLLIIDYLMQLKHAGITRCQKETEH